MDLSHCFGRTPTRTTLAMHGVPVHAIHVSQSKTNIHADLILTHWGLVIDWLYFNIWRLLMYRYASYLTFSPANAKIHGTCVWQRDCYHTCVWYHYCCLAANDWPSVYGGLCAVMQQRAWLVGTFLLINHFAGVLRSYNMVFRKFIIWPHIWYDRYSC